VLDIVDLSKNYDSFRALDRVSFSVERGSFTTILGPSGSGKSTLLLAISGFVQPSSGDIRLDGTSLLGAAPEDRNFGIVFQGYALFPHLRVGANVAFPLQMRGMSKAEIAARVRTALERVKLLELIDRYPRELSGGQQQRVALARALVFDPQLVLLDEPLSALDKNLREALREELRRLHSQIGMTFVLVTHDQEEALELSDRIAVINHGRLEQYASPSTLYDAPATRFVAGFLGKSSLIKAAVQGREGRDICLLAGSTRIRLTSDARLPAGDVLLVLRPEHVFLVQGAPPAASNVVSGKVTDRSYRGAEIIVTVTTGVGDILVRLAAATLSTAPAVGEAVAVGWREDAGWLLPDRDG
jgi:putative spermidine/putrescine transport system ATP-binding protein